MIPEQYSLDKLFVDDVGSVRLALGEWEPCIFFGESARNIMSRMYSEEELQKEIDPEGFLDEVSDRDQEDHEFNRDHPDFSKIYSEHKLEYIAAAKKLLVKSML